MTGARLMRHRFVTRALRQTVILVGEMRSEFEILEVRKYRSGFGEQSQRPWSMCVSGVDPAKSRGGAA
jgi:hypothetical protein